MKLTFQQLQDYMRCPMTYHFRHHLGGTKASNHHEQFEQALVKSILHFYYNIMDGNMVITNAQLKQRWERFWGQEDINPYEFILTPIMGSIPMGGHKNRRVTKDGKHYNLMLKGWSILNNIHRGLVENPGKPIAVDLGFEIQIGQHTITDTIQLARKINNKIEVVSFSGKTPAPTEFEIRNDLRTTFQVYGFRKIFNTPEDNVIIYDLERNRKITTLRTKKDTDRLETIVKNVCDSIGLGIFFPRQTPLCNTCNYCHLCQEATSI